MTTSPLTGTDQIAELRAELDMYRQGMNQLTIDPMRAGQPVHETFDWHEGEPRYYLQQTHRGMPIFSCAVCDQVTVGEPTGCVKCGTDHGSDLTAHLYETRGACRSWAANYGGQYDGLCLISGSDGCECPDE